MLKIKDLTVVADNKIILNKLNLDIETGKIWAIMGPNGVGKSTICKVLLKDPNYLIKQGSIIYNGKIINDLSTDQRAKLGLFLIAQTPTAIEGVQNSEMLRMAIANRTGKAVDILSFHKEIKEVCQKLDIPNDFIHRDINAGMSGGERKKNELMHLWMLKPEFIILDEIDSGLDVDAFKIVMKSLKDYYKKYHPSILIITHNTKVFKYLKPDGISILEDGKIIKTGTEDLANIIDENGFEAFKVSESVTHE